jgi:hypothetical protein
MNLHKLLKIFSDKQCRKVYVKRLSANDNSKNQVYLGGSFEVVNILPIKEVVSEDPGDWKRMRFKSKLDFYWINSEAVLSHAPDAQLILYPKYPEVRFSGFLKGVKDAPSDLMTNRIEGRLLFLGIADEGRIVGHIVGPDSEISNEFSHLKNLQDVGVFKELTIQDGVVELDSKSKLLQELKRIHELEWIDAKRLDSLKNILPCISSNCGGYTLEAELGITPNGYSEPDYLGWEIKQFSVKNFNKWQSEVITLMTPEPTHGYYADQGVEAFIKKYGYQDKKGREARMNFGGIHKFNLIHSTTNLKMIMQGFNNSEGKITDTNGFIALIDTNEKIAASWSFVSLLKHWNTKHANACYVPSMNRKDQILYPFSKQQYCYGNNIMLGSGTDFALVLKQIVCGNLYYDPGIKLELAIEGQRKQTIKRRSQFRIKSNDLSRLYNKTEIINITNQNI